MYQQPIIQQHQINIDTDKIPGTGQQIRYSDMNFITESLFQDGSIYLNDDIHIFNPQSQTTSALLSGIPVPIFSHGQIFLPTKYAEEEHSGGGGGHIAAMPTANYTPIKYYLCLNNDDNVICLDYLIAFISEPNSGSGGLE